MYRPRAPANHLQAYRAVVLLVAGDLPWLRTPAAGALDDDQVRRQVHAKCQSGCRAEHLTSSNSRVSCYYLCEEIKASGAHQQVRGHSCVASK